MRNIFIFLILLAFLSSCGQSGSAVEPAPEISALNTDSANEPISNEQSSGKQSSDAPSSLTPPDGAQSSAGGGSQSQSQSGTISVMYYGGEAERDPLSESTLGQFELDVRLIPYPSDYAALISLLASDAPDMFMLSLSPSRLAELTAGGYIREIPDETLAANTNLNTYVRGNAAAQANRKIYGAYAYLPCDYDADPVYAADSARFFYRKDWAATLSLPLPNNPGDLYAMAAAYAAQQNPNRTDGSTLTGLAVDSVSRIAALYGYDLSGWVEENGRYVPAYYSGGILPMLNYARRFHGEGILKFTDTEMDLNNAGILVTRADNAAELEKIILTVAEPLNITEEETLESHVGVMAVPRDPEAPRVWENHVRQDGWLFSRKVTDGTLEKLLAFFDYTLTDEARVSSRYGISGITYSQTPDGIFMFTNPETYAAYDLSVLYPTGGFLNLLIDDASREADVNYPSEIPFEIRRFFADSAKRYYIPSLPGDMLRRSVNSPRRDAFSMDYEGYLHDIVTGTEPVDVLFEQFKDTCRQSGIEAVIEEVGSRQ